MGLIPEWKEVNKHQVRTIHELAPNPSNVFHVNTSHFHQGSPNIAPRAPIIYLGHFICLSLAVSHKPPPLTSIPCHRLN